MLKYFANYQCLVKIWCIIHLFTVLGVASSGVYCHKMGVLFAMRYFSNLFTVSYCASMNSGIFLCIGDRNPIHPQPFGSCGPLQK